MNHDALGKLLLGGATGIAFGILLQKGQAAKHEKIIGQLRLHDWDVAKIMGVASLVGGLGTALLRRRGYVEPSIKPLQVGGVVTGAALFGAGMATLGYCPGTSVAAVGEGRRDAAAGVLGMFFGALAYVHLLPRMKSFIERGDYGKKTVPELLQTGDEGRVGLKSA